MNDYNFWKQYNERVKLEISKLCKKKKILYIDLHIHSNYSSDGNQSISQILKNTKAKGFDIISITDHDSLTVYEELFEFVKNGLTQPIIIPGIEFNIDNSEYGNQCHFLQLFVNPKDKLICEDVKKNYDSTFNRSKLQFKRIEENKVLQEIFLNNKIMVSYDEYIVFLTKNKLIPEYDTLALYLGNKLFVNNVTTFKILEKLEKENELDIYEDRKNYKIERYKKLREKYEMNKKNEKDIRFLLSMLAVREVDDDWWESPSSGSLSVNSYGQLKIEQLNTAYDTYFAHPTEMKMNIVKKILNENCNIKGMELNIRNNYKNIDTFLKLIKEYNLKMIIGSDSHDDMSEFYQNLDFYKINSEDVLNLIK